MFPRPRSSPYSRATHFFHFPALASRAALPALLAHQKMDAGEVFGRIVLVPVG
jgi:hypothetical protein